MNPSDIAQVVSAVAAIGAVVTSAVSIYISVSALEAQRRHDRISVRPILEIDLGDYEDRLFVRLQNTGVGPATIKSIVVTNLETGASAKSVVAQMPKLPPHFFWETFIVGIDGRAISAQKDLTLLSFVGNSPSIQEKYPPGTALAVRNDVRKSLGACSIGVTYTDIYESRDWTKTRSLRWFRRRLSKDGEEQAKKGFQPDIVSSFSDPDEPLP